MTGQPDKRQPLISPAVLRRVIIYSGGILAALFYLQFMPRKNDPDAKPSGPRVIEGQLVSLIKPSMIFLYTTVDDKAAEAMLKHCQKHYSGKFNFTFSTAKHAEQFIFNNALEKDTTFVITSKSGQLYYQGKSIPEPQKIDSILKKLAE